MCESAVPDWDLDEGALAVSLDGYPLDCDGGSLPTAYVAPSGPHDEGVASARRWETKEWAAPQTWRGAQRRDGGSIEACGNAVVEAC